jgi:hypothetical protein
MTQPESHRDKVHTDLQTGGHWFKSNTAHPKIGTGPGQFFFPSGIAVAASGDIYVSDEVEQVQVFKQAAGTF